MRMLLPLFPKPSHYAGIEDGIILKSPAELTLHLALAFPDAYEVGMSYLGHKILYNIINSQPGWFAERVMAPEKEASTILREHGVPLSTLETSTPLHKLDAVGFAITHELCYTDVVHMLDLGHIPLRFAARPESLSECPVIMAGGGAMIGAEPLSPFLDLVMLGDGEETLPDVLKCLEKAKRARLTRSAFLREAAKIPGVYVPSLFVEKGDGSLISLVEGYRPARRIIADLDDVAYPVRQVMPVGAVHNRLALEIARGCTRGCRFCHAGMTYRPVRERSSKKLLAILDECLDATGFEEASFLSLSTGDFSSLDALWEGAFERCAREQISLALPSLRVGSMNEKIMAKMEALRRTGCTLAPEAGSQRLRNVINKGITEEELLAHARLLLQHGWRHVKLYFMIGLPTETDADLEAIADLCRKTRDAGGFGAPRLKVTASLSPFVPKPFTPFQWEAQISRDEIIRRVNYCRTLFKKEKSLVLRWHEPASSHLEGILSRGGRELADVIEKAYQKGAIFCGWAEHFQLDPWLEALDECQIDPASLTGGRIPGSPLPWSHIEAGISEDFLLRERNRAYSEKITPDCRHGSCALCGACDVKSHASLLPHCNAKRHGPILNGEGSRSEIAVEGRPIPAVQSLPRLNDMLANRNAHYRIWHSKLGNYAFLSQLELQAVIARTLRRAKLPVAFSRGFHPLPLISFGRALQVGAQSEVEWVGLTLHSYLAPHKLMAGLNIFLPAEMSVHKVELVEKRRKTEQAIAEEFRLVFPSVQTCNTGAKLFEEFFSSESFVWKRMTKKGEQATEIRPLLKSWRKNSTDIQFMADWSENYISPISFTNLILMGEHKPPEPHKAPQLIKIRQVFEGNREYFK